MDRIHWGFLIKMKVECRYRKRYKKSAYMSIMWSPVHEKLIIPMTQRSVAECPNIITITGTLQISKEKLILFGKMPRKGDVLG